MMTKPNPPMDASAAMDAEAWTVGQYVKITKGQYKGEQGRIKEVSGQRVIVKLTGAGTTEVGSAEISKADSAAKDSVRMLENDISLLEARKRVEPRRRAALDAEIAGKRFEIGQYELAAGVKLSRKDAADMDERDWKGVEEWIAEEKGEGEHRGDAVEISKAGIGDGWWWRVGKADRWNGPYKTEQAAKEAAKREGHKDSSDLMTAIGDAAEKINEIGRRMDAIPGLTPKGLWRLGWDRAEEGSSEQAATSGSSGRDKEIIMEGYRAFKNGEKRK